MKNKFAIQVLKGTVSTTSGTMISTFIGFLNIMIATRVVSKEAMGVYLFLFVIVNFVLILCDMGLNISLTRELSGSEGHRDIDNTINSVFIVKFIVIISLSFLIYSLKHFLVKTFNGSLNAEAINYLSIMIIFEGINLFYKSVLQGLKLFKKMAVSQIIISISNFIFILYLVVHSHYGIFGLVLSRLLSLTIGITFQFVVQPLRIEFKFDVQRFKKLFIFGYTLGINNLFTVIFTRFAMFLIGAFLGPVAIAGYGVASKIPDGFSQIFESFRTVYFPSLSELHLKNKSEEVKKVLNYSIKVISFISLLATLIIFLFSKQILQTLFSSTYVEYAPILSLLMAALSLSFVGNILGTTLVALGNSRLPMFINIVGMVVNVLSNLILLKKFGLKGAAFAAMLSVSATIPLNAFFVIRCGTGLKVWELIRPFLFFIACVSIYHFIFPEIFILKVSVVILFLAAAYFFHFNKNELKKIAHLFIQKS